MYLWLAYRFGRDTSFAMCTWGNTLFPMMLFEIDLFPLLKMLYFMFHVSKLMSSLCPPSNLHISGHIMFTLDGVHILTNVVIIDPTHMHLALQATIP